LVEQKKEQEETGQTWKQWCEEQKTARPSFPVANDCTKYTLIARYPGAYKAGDSIKEEYKAAGFDSFADYMDKRQPCGIKCAMAYKLIAAMKLRPMLPDIISTTGIKDNVWTERAIRPLLHKDFTPADQKRIGKKIATCTGWVRHRKGCAYYARQAVATRACVRG
jgi:hypothetical protein